jgi:hypothetical protein
LEFGVPPSRLWRALWTAYVRAGLPALGRLVSREWRDTGAFLARSIPDFYAHRSLRDLAALWERAGVAGVHVRPMSFGAGVVMWGTRADDGAPAA